MLWDLNLIAVERDHWNILCRVLVSGLSLEERTLKDWILKAVLELAGEGEFALFLKFLLLCSFGQLKAVYIQVVATRLQA